MLIIPKQIICSIIYIDHIDVTVNKARKTIGMIKGFSIRISDPLCLKGLYCSLVRPILEYTVLLFDVPAHIHPLTA